MFTTIKNPKACIWVKLEEDKYQGIFLEKFPELFHAGYMLLTEYTTLKKVQDLIALGDLFLLKEFPHSERHQDAIYECESIHKMFNEPIKILSTNNEKGTKRAEYSYLYKDNQWYFNICENYQLLSHDWIEDSIENPIIFRRNL